jgi:hypothetical protein
MSQTDEQSPSPQVLEQGYEPSDVSVRGLMIFLVIFVVGAVVIQFGLWELVKYYVSLPRSADVVTSAAPAPRRFPAPNLQPIETHNQLPWQDLADLRREKGLIFDELGWTTDASTGQPVIPDQIVNALAKDRSEKSAVLLPSGAALSSFPSPGTPGEGQGGGPVGESRSSAAHTSAATLPPPQPSPGVPGEGGSGLPLRGNIASAPPAPLHGGKP